MTMIMAMMRIDMTMAAQCFELPQPFPKADRMYPACSKIDVAFLAWLPSMEAAQV